MKSLGGGLFGEKRQEERVTGREEERKPLLGIEFRGMTPRYISGDIQGIRGWKLSNAGFPRHSQHIYANPWLPETLFWPLAPEALSFPSLAHSWSLLFPRRWGRWGRGMGQELMENHTVCWALCWDCTCDSHLFFLTTPRGRDLSPHFRVEEGRGQGLPKVKRKCRDSI